MGRCLRVLLVVLWSAAFATSARAADLTVITEDYPPLNYVEDKVLTGPAVDIVRAIEKRLGVDAPIKVYPWARGYTFLQTKPNTALFTIIRSPEREKLFKWVGPLAEKKIGLFARRDSTIRLESLGQARKYVIGVQLDGAGMHHLKAEGFEKLDASIRPVGNLKKLLSGRNDLWYSSDATALGNCRRLKMKTCDVRLVLLLRQIELYVAFSKATADTIVAQWQQAYDAPYAHGTVERIYRDHGTVALYPSRK